MDDLDEVFRLLEMARLLENDGQRIEAATKYYEGCHLMRQILSTMDSNADTHFPQADKHRISNLLREKIQFFTKQAQRLYFDEGSVMPPPPVIIRPMARPATITLSAKTSDDVSVLTLPGNQPSIFTEMHRKTGTANARLEQAIRLEEEAKNRQSIRNHNHTNTIINSYMSAAEVYLSVLRLAEESSLESPATVQSRLKACLDRIEELKNRPSGRISI